jgi:hypothetical protein
MTASATRRGRALFRSIPRTHGRRDARRQRQTLEHLVADKALIDAAQSFGESLEHALQSADDRGEVVQQAPTVELSDVISDSLDAKSALAFWNRSSKPTCRNAAMQLEDCQIIRRSLDRDLPFGRPHGAWTVFRPALIAEVRLDRVQVQRRSAAIDQSLENFLHTPADHKDQVPAVLHLVGGEGIAKPAASLFFKIERKT